MDGDIIAKKTNAMGNLIAGTRATKRIVQTNFQVFSSKRFIFIHEPCGAAVSTCGKVVLLAES